jgi:hypothetical protein
MVVAEPAIQLGAFAAGLAGQIGLPHLHVSVIPTTPIGDGAAAGIARVVDGGRIRQAGELG